MSRENILFSVVGLLLGYVIAFHLVVYINQSQTPPPAPAGGAESAAGLPADHPALAADEADERRRLLAEAEEAARAARQEPQNFDAQLKAGEGYFRAGSFEEAIDFMTRANRLRPGDYDTVVRLGTIYSSAGRFEDAAEWYSAALAKKPDDCDARSELALTYYMRKPSQAERAISELRRCLETNPNHVPSLHNLTLMLLETNKVEESASVLARLEKADPTYDQLPRLRQDLEKARAAAPQKKSPTD
jgi:tetratricopeptide (TPR) repeat protein